MTAVNRMAGTIVCDVTDAAEGRSAAGFANALGARLGLRLVLASVLDAMDAAVRDSVSGRQRQGAVDALARELGGDVETRIAAGDRAEALARVAAEEGADLVVVGSRAVGFGGRNLRCTVVRDLEAATPVPVLVAPPSTRRRSARRLALAAHADTR